MFRCTTLLLALFLLSSRALLLRADDDPKPLAIGAAAPDFELPGVDGKLHGLKEYASAKLLAVVFTCNHCPTAQAYEERLKRLVEEYRAKGVAFVAISPNDPESVRLNELGYTDLSDSFDEMKIRSKDRAYNFPYLYDGETEKVSRAYGPAATPHVFLFDEARKLRYAGRIDDSEDEARVKSRDLQNALDALLAGNAAPVETTKTFGCSIKWAKKKDEVRRLAPKPKADEIRLEEIGTDDLAKLVASKSDKVRVINVWATTCGPCVAEFPEIVTLKRMYGHRSFELITVSGDRIESKDKVLEFLRKQDCDAKNYIFGPDDKAKLVNAVDKDWGGAIPFTLICTPEGKVVYRRMGEIEILEARRAIVKSLKEDRK